MKAHRPAFRYAVDILYYLKCLLFLSLFSRSVSSVFVVTSPYSPIHQSSNYTPPSSVLFWPIYTHSPITSCSINYFSFLVHLAFSTLSRFSFALGVISPFYRVNIQLNASFRRNKKKLNSVALVRKRNIPTERQPLVGKVSTSFRRTRFIITK
jgi:hypothetical protein